MTAETLPELDWIPDACNLPTSERPLRVAEFDVLLAGTCDTERITATRLRVTLTGGPELPATVRELTEREARCGSFFSFTVSVEPPDTVRPDIEVPARTWRSSTRWLFAPVTGGLLAAKWSRSPQRPTAAQGPARARIP